MKLKTPLDKARIISHFQYNAWKYVLIVLSSIFVWDLVYNYTAYRPPQDKRIDIYTQNAHGSQEDALAYLDALAKRVVPEVELVTLATLLGNSESDMYAAQQLTTYMAAREGDLYFLSGIDFKRFASQGAFIDLEPFLENGTLQTGDIALSAGKVAMQEYDAESETMQIVSQQRLYGIPAASLAGFPAKLGIDQRDLYLGVTAFSGNEEKTLIFLNALLQDMREPPEVETEVIAP